jgi:biopolymer transport protein ExbD
MKRNDESLEVPMSSLIDIVFLLIIFFVVTSTMQKDVIDDQLKLAKSTYIPPLMEGVAPQAITINIRHEFGSNQVVYKIGGGTYTEAQILRVLTQARNRHGNQVPIILRVDETVKYKDVQKINNLVGRAGLYRVSHVAEYVGTR